MRKVKINKIYKHFMGNYYIVTDIAIDCETLEKVIVYKSLYDDKTWVRKYIDFVSLVDKDKYKDVKQKYRFEEVNFNSIDFK